MPHWKEILVPAWKDIQVPDWKQYWTPELVKVRDLESSQLYPESYLI